MDMPKFKVQKREGTEALRTVLVPLRSISDYVTPVTGVSNVKAQICGTAGNNAASTNNIVELDATNHPGVYKLVLTAAEVAAVGRYVITVKSSTAVGQCLLEVVDYNPLVNGAASAPHMRMRAGLSA